MDQVCEFFSLRQPESNRALGLETEQEYRKRWISIRVMYFTAFIVYIAFSAMSTSLWPYYKSLDPDAEKHFLFYLFAIPSLVQLVLSPLFGYLNNKLTSIRLPMMLFIVLMIVGQVLYAVIEEIPNNRKYALLTSRGLIGGYTVACTIYRAYTSAATTVAERTKTTSYMSLAQTLGLVGGAAVPWVFAGLGEEGFQLLGLRINTYTSVAWFLVALGVINLVVLIPWIFQDQNIAIKEAMAGHAGPVDGKKAWQQMELRYLPIVLMVVAFALVMFVYSALQTSGGQCDTMVKWITLKQSDKDRSLGLETGAEYRQRWLSIRVVYFIGFLMFLAFGIVATGIWPYLKSLDPSISKVFLGYAFAVPPLGQLIFSPFFGWWTNKLSSIRIPLILLVIIFTLANVLYAVIEEFQDHRKYILLIARGLVGIATSAVTICRAYISSATRLSERTKTISYMSLAQCLGLMIGPIMQSLFSGIGEDGFHVFGLFRVTMYSVAGWICVFLGLFNLILLLPVFFKDSPIAVKEAMKTQGATNAKETWKSIELQYFSITIMITAFSVLMLVYVAFQTLLSPIALDQFNWTNEESLFYLGILMTAGALISCVLFLMLDSLCKRFSETNVLVYGAMLTLFISQLVMIPVGSEPITAFLKENGNSTGNGTAIGCPPTQEWCSSIPPIGKVQFTISYTLLCISFSIGTTLSQAVFSKLLGPRPQGTWMALLTCAGSVARILGPGAVTVYVLSGTYWTFGGGSILTGLVFVWMWVYRNQLQPVIVHKQHTAEEMKVLNPSKLAQ